MLLPNNTAKLIIKYSNILLFIISSYFLFSHFSYARQSILPSTKELSKKPIGSLTSILQGSDALWVGSDSGLLGITGNHTFHFDYSNSPLSSDIVDIIQDNQKRLWLITVANGVIQFDPLTHEFIQFNQETGLDFNQCLFATLLVDTLYVTCIGGVYAINTSTQDVSEILTSSNLYNVHETAFIEVISDKKGSLFLIGVDKKLYKYIPDTKLIETIELGDINLGRITTLMVDSNNTLWMSTESGEYNLKETSSGYNISHIETDIQHDQFLSIFEDGDGDIWFGGDVFLKLQKNSNKLIYAPFISPIFSKRPNISIIGITEGPNGELYLLSPATGIISLLKITQAVSNLTDSDEQYLNTIQSLEKLDNNSFLLNFYWANKLVHYNSTTDKINVITEESLDIDDFQIISESEVLFAEAKTGLHKISLSDSKIQKIDSEHLGLPSTSQNRIGTINVDNKGDIYISISGPGIGIYKGNLKEGFEKIYSDIDVYSSLVGRNSNMFFATRYNGVKEYTKDKHWRHWSAPKNIGRAPYTRCMVQDKNGIIWLCQSRNGLAYLDELTQSIKYIDRSYTAGSDVIRSIVPDIQGYLWVATSQGLVRYDHENKASIVLGKEHGFFDSDFDFSSSQHSIDKIILSGKYINYNINTTFVNEQLNTRLQQKTEVQIVDMQVSRRGSSLTQRRKRDLEKSIEESRPFNLLYEEFLFTLEFAVNNFIEKEQFSFEYRLLGLNDQWAHLSNGENSITYTTLPSGNYTLEVRTVDYRSNAKQPITRLSIKVLPPYWLTWQAYIIYAFCVLLSFYGIYRYRTRQLTKANIQLEKAVETRTQELTERSNELTERTSELSQSHAQISSLLAQKESLFANVSHEFRTPLTLILGPMSQLRPKLADDSDIQQFDMMQRNTKRLVQLVEQILELARLDTAVESPKKIYAIDSALGILVNSFKPLAELKSQDIVFTNHCSGGLELTADALEKILYNLLSNAIKYSPEGGTITVTGEQVNNQYRLSIQDTGYGIPEDELETIFERFTRLEKTSEQLGSGLGLAVVKELVQANEGIIEVESELNKGTTFTVTFPLLSDFDESEAKPLSDKLLALDSASELVTQTVNSSLALDTDSKSKETNKPVLLIIEDNQDMQAYIKQSLDNEYECITANNGQQGIDMAVEHIPDMILSDLMMPLKGGFEVVDHLRSNELTAHIPITLLTAKGDDNSRLTGWQKTVDDYIAKPFNVEELELRLSRLLSVRDIVKKTGYPAAESSR